MPKEMSRRDEQRGTRSMFLAAAIVALAVGFGLLAWFFVPGFSARETPKNAGVRSDQTVGVSVASQRTEPLRVDSPNSTGSYTVGRNEAITGTEKPTLKPLSAEQVKAIQSYAAAHPQQVLPNVDFSIAIGAAVPESFKLLDVPPQLGATLPDYAKDKYLVVNGQFIVVESQTRRIVAIVPTPNARETAR